jgi:hypothetical protein
VSSDAQQQEARQQAFAHLQRCGPDVLAGRIDSSTDPAAVACVPPVNQQTASTANKTRRMPLGPVALSHPEVTGKSLSAGAGPAATGAAAGKIPDHGVRTHPCQGSRRIPRFIWRCAGLAR